MIERWGGGGHEEIDLTPIEESIRNLQDLIKFNKEELMNTIDGVKNSIPTIPAIVNSFDEVESGVSVLDAAIGSQIDSRIKAITPKSFYLYINLNRVVWRTSAKGRFYTFLDELTDNDNNPIIIPKFGRVLSINVVNWYVLETNTVLEVYYRDRVRLALGSNINSFSEGAALTIDVLYY